MSEPNREQIIKALKLCDEVSEGMRSCKGICPYEKDIDCVSALAKDALALIKQQDTAYNELYELTESYRKELVSVRADTVRKIADFIWEKDYADTLLPINGRYLSKQEFIDQIAKDMVEGVCENTIN